MRGYDMVWQSTHFWIRMATRRYSRSILLRR
jgi:hypothetical protein